MKATKLSGHPYLIPADVKLNEKEMIVLQSLMESAGGNGYDFGFTDWNEATKEAVEAMPKGQKSYRSYVSSLAKKGLIYTYGTEINENGNYSQFDIRMEEAEDEDEVTEVIHDDSIIPMTIITTKKVAKKSATKSSKEIVLPVDNKIRAEDLMNFNLFYSKRSLLYSMPASSDGSYLTLKGNKSDFYSKLKDMDPNESIKCEIDDESITILG